jgi:hypothetical protein
MSSPALLLGVKTSRKRTGSKASDGKGKESCGKCNKIVSERDLSIECEICVKWYHIKCTGNLVSEDLSTCAKSGVHWYCDKCNEPLGTFQNRIEGLEQNVLLVRESIAKSFEEQNVEITKSFSEMTSRFQEKSASLEELVKQSVKDCVNVATEKQGVDIIKSYAGVAAELNEKIEIIENSFRTQTQNILQQQAQIETERSDKAKRSRNVIVFGLKETVDVKSTAKALRDFLHTTCHLNLSFTDSEVIRLGPKKDDGKARPVRLILESESQKCRRAQTSTTNLNFQGLNHIICISHSGMPDWEKAGFPVET